MADNLKWKRFRSEDGATWRNREEWPAGSAQTILVYNACDGFHLWRRWDDYTPPGTHWSIPSKPQAAVRAHAAAIRKHYDGPSPLE